MKCCLGLLLNERFCFQTGKGVSPIIVTQGCQVLFLSFLCIDVFSYIQFLLRETVVSYGNISLMPFENIII